VIDLVGERTEDIQIGDESAVLWFQTNAVQVRAFRGSQEPCDSFTVTVGGGTEDENRHAVVDLAERVVLGSELPQPDPEPAADNKLAGTEWFLTFSTLAGEPKNAGEALLFTFTDTEASWTDGCNQLSATYTYFGSWITLDDINTTDVDCEATPTSEAVNEVMRTGDVAVTLSDHDGQELELRNGEGVLILGQAGRTIDEPPTVTTDQGEPIAAKLAGLWEITELRDGDEVVPLPRGELLAEFSDTTVSWNDGCNGAGSEVTYGDGSFRLAGIASTAMGCPDEDSGRGRGIIDSVFLGQPVSVTFNGDRPVLKTGDKTVTLQRR